MTTVSAVAIGRNEGERLERCLRSLLQRADRVVYVDSGSTDGSVEAARALGAEVVELDMSRPFSAARARNAGVEQLEREGQCPQLIQFIDGDCVLTEGWLQKAAETHESQPDAAIVCGRLRELYPERSVYNRLCDMEWNMPIGEIEHCGGIFTIRADAFEQVGGFDPNLVAGEEPEMCVRLRQGGWRVLRIDAEMARHDAAMHTFSQWWRRTVRNGHAFAEGAARHGRSPQRHWLRESRSIWFWGLIYPLILLALAWPTFGLSFLGFGAYPLMVIRIARKRRQHGDPWRHGLIYGLFVMLGKLPETIGQATYWWNRLRGRGSRVIEHKPDAPRSGQPGVSEQQGGVA